MIETMDILLREARRTSAEGVGLQRNKHLCNPPEGMTQEHLDAALCGFVNSFAYFCCGMDYALHTGGLKTIDTGLCEPLDPGAYKGGEL